MNDQSSNYSSVPNTVMSSLSATLPVTLRKYFKKKKPVARTFKNFKHDI